MSSLSIPALRGELAGRVIAPEDPDYDHARRLFAGGFDRKPDVIVQPIDATEVARVVTLARETGSPLAVRSGGHSAAGHSVSDGGITLHLGALKGLDIDAGARTAWAQTGVTAGEYTTATVEQGLATGFGDTGSVGLGGITLGGGVGFLSRKYGLTVDNLLAAEVVTADGSVVQASEREHPDLFWAIRGGGGNFGVATRFHYRLQEVPQIVGGLLILPATVEVVAGFIAAAEAAPEELSTIANVMNAPPMPFLPPEVHGQMIVMGMMCYAGDPEDGERAMAPFRALATPLADMVQTMPYSGMFAPEDPNYRPTAAARNMYVDRVDEEVATTILEHLNNSDAPMRVTQLRVLGGAISRVPDDATAYAHRQAKIMVNVAAFYTGPDDKPAKEAWVNKLSAALHQGDDAVYVNFLADEGRERLRAAYPGRTWDRLVEVKRRYDPDNLFRLNQNIPVS